jgi:hypothetical protein
MKVQKKKTPKYSHLGDINLEKNNNIKKLSLLV